MLQDSLSSHRVLRLDIELFEIGTVAGAIPGPENHEILLGKTKMVEQIEHKT
jgi:hypothetical protein